MTLVVSAVVWSTSARLTVAAAFMTSVLMPVPPSIESFGAVIGDGVVAGTGRNDVGATAAVDGVVARTARDDVRAGGASDRDR